MGTHPYSPPPPIMYPTAAPVGSVSYFNNNRTDVGGVNSSGHGNSNSARLYSMAMALLAAAACLSLLLLVGVVSRVVRHRRARERAVAAAALRAQAAHDLLQRDLLDLEDYGLLLMRERLELREGRMPPIPMSELVVDGPREDVSIPKENHETYRLAVVMPGEETPTFMAQASPLSKSTGADPPPEQNVSFTERVAIEGSAASAEEEASRGGEGSSSSRE